MKLIELLKTIYENQPSYDLHSIQWTGANESFTAVDTTETKAEQHIFIEIDSLKAFISSEKEDYNFAYFHTSNKREGFYHQRFNKNVSLILLMQVDSIEVDEKIKRQILEIEEDPYYFKKYVLTYTSGQLDDFNKMLEQKTIDELSDLVLGLDFEEFKKNPYSDSYANLLLSIYIKIPLLTVPHDASPLPDLTKAIVNKHGGEDGELNLLRNSLLEESDKELFELLNIPTKLNDDEQL